MDCAHGCDWTDASICGVGVVRGLEGWVCISAECGRTHPALSPCSRNRSQRQRTSYQCIVSEAIESCKDACFKHSHKTAPQTRLTPKQSRMRHATKSVTDKGDAMTRELCIAPRFNDQT
jgi:hypothetical protein